MTKALAYNTVELITTVKNVLRDRLQDRDKSKGCADLDIRQSGRESFEPV
jgi:hypothetical protein